VFEQAAAYLFHLSRNHPFVDGNERTASMTALAFLGTNGHVSMRRPPGSMSS
jgi:death on curing protein